MARKYQGYPEYKNSGVEWLGKIPTEWDMWKIAHACPYVASGTTPKTDSDTYYGGDNLWVTTGELRESIIIDTQKKITGKALVDMPTLRLHPKGSVAIAMYGATIGRLGNSEKTLLLIKLVALCHHPQCFIINIYTTGYMQRVKKSLIYHLVVVSQM